MRDSDKKNELRAQETRSDENLLEMNTTIS